MPPLKFFLEIFYVRRYNKRKGDGTMRSFDEFTKIAKKEFNREDYPYGYRKDKKYVARRVLQATGAGAAAGGALSAIDGVKFDPKLSAILSGVAGAATGGAVLYKLCSKKGRQNRDLSWASSKTQKKLKNLEDNLHTIDVSSVPPPDMRKVFGVGSDEAQEIPQISYAFTATSRVAPAEYENARKQAILEGRSNRLNKHAELDELYYEKIAADAPDIESEKDIIPKLTQEVTYSPKEKTPPTPGGKVTPSKYVQRKNKARYQD